jgi:GxxExxY protein
MVHELTKAGLKVERQVSIPIMYDGISFDEGYRIDLLVEDQIIVELKAAEQMNALWEAQLISYLKLMNLRLGFLINFKVPIIKYGIRRYRI